VRDEELRDENLELGDYGWLGNVRKVVMAGGNVPRDARIQALFPIPASSPATSDSSSFSSSSSSSASSSSSSSSSSGSLPLFSSFSSLHVIGASDQVVDPADSLILSECFHPSRREYFHHAGGHLIPQDAEGRKVFTRFLSNI